jgi:glycerophosphoryl diester phosphodiesterase
MTRGLVEELHANDLAVWSWPTTEEDPLVSSIEVGADAVMGDDIGLMVHVLDRLRPREGQRDSVVVSGR